MLYYLATTVYVAPCLLLLLVVLLQQGKGGDMASAFGGGGSQTAFGARAGASVLTRATTVLGVLFMHRGAVARDHGSARTGSLLSGERTAHRAGPGAGSGTGAAVRSNG